MLLGRVKHHLRSADNSSFLLGAIVLQSLARKQLAVFLRPTNRADALVCLRALERDGGTARHLRVGER